MFLRDFALFTLLILLVVVVFIIVAAVILILTVGSASKMVTVDAAAPLAEGNYEGFKASEYLGARGFVCVLDESGATIYLGNELAENFSADVLSLISVESDYSFDVRSVTRDKDGREYFELKLADREGYAPRLIVDVEGRVLFSTFEDGKNEYGGTALAYIKGDVYGDYTLSKMDLTGSDGRNCTVVFFRDIQALNHLRVWKLLPVVLITLFIAVIVIPLILFVIKVDRSVKRPVLMLNRAICDFTEGDRSTSVEYAGPKEFQTVCDSFNKMAAALNKSEEERLKAEGEKRLMLSDISHDLKTPITIIEGYAKALLDDRVSEAEKKEYLEVICKRAESLAELITAFSEYNKLERADFSIRAERTDVCEFLRGYVIDKYEELELAGFSVDSNIPEETIECAIDTFHMSRVFDNLISNVVKYNAKGTTIFVSLKREERGVTISLADNGAGISDGLRKTVFKPFVVGESSRTGKAGGSGLGLAITERIVHLHGGNIRLGEKREGISTEFLIELPCCEDGNIKKI